MDRPSPERAVPDYQTPIATPAPAPAQEAAAPQTGGWNSFALDSFGYGAGGGVAYAPKDAPGYALEKGGLSQTTKLNGLGGPQTQKVSGSVRGDGANGAIDRSIKTESNGVTTRGNLLASADVTARVEPTSDPAFGVLVVTFTLGGEGGFAVGGVGREASGKDPEAPATAPVAPGVDDLNKHVAAEVSGEVGLKVKGSGSVALRHRLPIVEAQEIARELQVPLADRYAILDRIGILAEELSSAGNVLAPLDAHTAAALAPGEGVELSIGGEVGVTAGAKASAGASVGATASGTASAKRTVRIEGNPDAKDGRTLKVTVTFEDAMKGSAGATASDGIASVGASAGKGEGSKRTFEIDMNPEDEMYEGDFRTLMTAVNAAAVAPIAARLKAKRAATESQTSERSVEVGFLALGGQLGSTQGRTQGTELSKDGLSGLESGDSSQTSAASLFGFQLYGEKQTERADARFSEGKGSVAIVDTDTVTTRFCKDKKTTSSMMLSGHDLIRLGQRFVENPVVWDDIGMAHWGGNIGEWHACGAALASPVADGDLLEAGLPLAVAIEGARYAAIASLASNGQGRAQAALLDVCGAAWTVRCGARGEATASTDALGVSVVWPGGLEDENDQWAALNKGWSALARSVSAVSDEAAAEAVLVELDEADVILATLQDAIAAHADAFADQTAGAVGLLVLLAERRELIVDWRGEVARLETGTCDVDSPPETAVDPAREVARLEGIVFGFKPQESALFAQLEAATASAWEDGPSAWLTADPDTASDVISKLGLLYVAWVPHITSLRTAYRAAGIDVQSWKVGPNGGAGRLGVEPDVARFQELRGTEGRSAADLISSY